MVTRDTDATIDSSIYIHQRNGHTTGWFTWGDLIVTAGDCNGHGRLGGSLINQEKLMEYI